MKDFIFSTPKASHAIGQIVFLTREIKGWFDFSMHIAIPLNSKGTVVGHRWTSYFDVNKMIYEVDFGKEFGVHIVSHTGLRIE